MSDKMNGTIEAVRKDGKAFKLQGDGWYSAFKAEQLSGAQKGDQVEFNYKTNGNFKNIDGSVTRLGSGGGSAPQAAGGGNAPKRQYNAGGGRSFPVGKTDGGRAINYQNAVTNAVKFLEYTKANGATPEDVIEVARYFAAFTTGDMDMESAEGYVDQ